MSPINCQKIRINFSETNIKQDIEITFRYLAELISQYKKKLRVRKPSRRRRARLPSDAIILNPDFEVLLAMPSDYLKNLRMTFVSTSHGIGLTCIIPNKLISFTVPPKSIHFVNIHALSSKRMARVITYDWMVENIMES